MVRRGEFRQGGRPHALLLVTDLSETLRAEEVRRTRELLRVGWLISVVVVVVPARARVTAVCRGLRGR